MNKWSELLVGLILVIASVIVVLMTWNLEFWNFGEAAWDFFKGGLVWFIFLIGILFILLGISDLKEGMKSPTPQMAEKPKKKK